MSTIIPGDGPASHPQDAQCPAQAKVPETAAIADPGVPAGPPLLAVSDLFKYYRETPAVQGISLAVRPGEIIGLVGPNGAGKTTVLRCIAGILRPTSGLIFAGGHSVADDPLEAKPLIALVPETPNLYELLTVTEHLRFIHMAYGEDGEFQLRADALLEHLDLREKQDALVATLSKGMRQKLALACAFIHSARIFLFDEPFIGIDPAGQRTVRNMIVGAAQSGAAVVISTHILDTVEHLCHRVLVINRGILIAEGSLDELRVAASMGGDVSLEDVFLTLTREAHHP